MVILSTLSVLVMISCTQKESQNEWVDLFNGKDLSGWKSNESDSSFQIKDGILIASGYRSHLFYIGQDGDASFKNFELEAEIKTTHLANSGIYFHTKWQEEGWLEVGLEAQVNASHEGGQGYREVKKSGSLYSLRNVYKSFIQDSVWHTMNLKVMDGRIQIRLDDMLIVDYTEPKEPIRYRAKGQDVTGEGTFALQCHDPESEVSFKSIKVKRLPDDVLRNEAILEETYTDILKFQSEHIAFIDYGVTIQDSTSLVPYLHSFYNSGINLGVIGGDFLSELDSYPVFTGYYLTDESALDAQIIGDYVDYRIGSIPIEILSIKDSLTQYLSSDRIDIWVNIEETPVELLEYALTTAADNGVAVAISEVEKIPSLDLIKQAKAAGCQFATTGLIDENGKVSTAYFMKMIENAKLDYKDIYIPGNS